MSSISWIVGLSSPRKTNTCLKADAQLPALLSNLIFSLASSARNLWISDEVLQLPNHVVLFVVLESFCTWFVWRAQVLFYSQWLLDRQSVDWDKVLENRKSVCRSNRCRGRVNSRHFWFTFGEGELVLCDWGLGFFSVAWSIQKRLLKTIISPGLLPVLFVTRTL